MAITRWDPFREVVALQNRVNSLFRDLNEGDDPLTTASFVPAVDIYEDPKKIVLKLEVPGIEEKDLDIRVENNTLTVKGERKFESRGEGTELPSHRAALRQLLPGVHAAHNCGHGERAGQLQRRRSEAGTGQEAGSPAEADQDQCRRPEPSWKQEGRAELAGVR